MTTATVTLKIPELLYQRLVNTAHATQRPLDEIMLQALQVGSPPAWDNVPDEFQADLAALDKLDDQALWKLVKSKKTPEQMERYNILLDKNKNNTLTETEQLKLIEIRNETDRFMLRKAQAAALLRWRGHVPIP